MYNIKQLQSEPHNQQQNYAERRIQDVKASTNTLMDRANSPDHLWYLCTEYVVHALNHIATKRLNKTSIEACFGVTPDISALLVFTWYEPVYDLVTDSSFPDSKESLGRFVGIADHVGDALTFKILFVTFPNKGTLYNILVFVFFLRHVLT